MQNSETKTLQGLAAQTHTAGGGGSDDAEQNQINARLKGHFSASATSSLISETRRAGRQ